MRTPRCHSLSAARRPAGGFTLVELLVVVAMIAVLSGLILPVLMTARDRARKARHEEAPLAQLMQRPLADTSPAPPAGAPPVIDSLALQMRLATSYRRIGMDVFTRYQADCTGRVSFQHPGDVPGRRVLLTIPFPEGTLEARDVELKLLPSDGRPAPANEVLYTRKGIYCACNAAPGQQLDADVRFTALGRERFDLALPPARQLRSVDVTLNLAGAEAHTIPDDALQPTEAGRTRIRWAFHNLVSDRQITVLIPGAEAPLARVLLLLRLLAIAVLLFGAGFWYLSEQDRPGQLSGFRLGHFLLLALTYSLFFVLFAVLEFHGTFSTPASMAVSAALSLPLLVLHVSRVLSFSFAVRRVVPLAAFTLGLVIDGVYGGEVRDYVFIGAAAFLMAYLTLDYQAWSGRREKHHREVVAAYAGRRRALAETLSAGLGAQIAALSAADAQAEERLKAAGERLPIERARLEGAREPVEGLKEEYQSLTRRLALLPAEPSWDAADAPERVERDAERLRDRLAPALARLEGDLAPLQGALAPPAGAGEVHCVACGSAVPDAPFCQQCGTSRPLVAACAGCGERLVVPMHLLGKQEQAAGLFCTRCGARVAELPGTVV